MTIQSTPSSDGTYRIKVVDQNLYIETVPYPNNPGLKLAALDSSSSKQKWILKKASQTNAWTITSANDNWGLTYARNQNTYWGYGYPYPQNGTSLTWCIIPQYSEGKSFSKIKLLNDSYSYCFDSVSTGSDAVHFYYDQQTYSKGQKQCYVFEPVSDNGNGGNNSIDVLFLQDFTGSQQPYIDKARAEIHTICTTLTSDGNFAPGNLRFGVVAFRDHVPQDSTFITKALTPVPNSNPQQVTFTTDPSVVASVLNSLTATGGGDGPEASADALQMAVQANWNSSATKVTILITDAPPHGLGENGDGFPDGCPLQIEPQRMARSMARLGITLYVVSCEPTLSGSYQHARAFYEGITETTGGTVYELGDPVNLDKFIRAAAVETIDHEAIVSQHGDTVRSLIQQNSRASNAEIAQKLHTHFEARNVKMRTLNFDRIVEQSSLSNAARVWFETETLAEGRAKLKQLGSGSSSKIASSSAQRTPTISTQPINLRQIQGIVQKVRMRG